MTLSIRRSEGEKTAQTLLVLHNVAIATMTHIEYYVIMSRFQGFSPVLSIFIMYCVYHEWSRPSIRNLTRL